jgi:hypothetical protein
LARARHFESRDFSGPPPLCSPYARRTSSRWKTYGVWRDNGALEPEVLTVSDVIYLGAGFGVLALMALYAFACDRL